MRLLGKSEWRGCTFISLKAFCIQRGTRPGSQATSVDFESFHWGRRGRAEQGKNPPGTGVNFELVKSC